MGNNRNRSFIPELIRGKLLHDDLVCLIFFRDKFVDIADLARVAHRDQAGRCNHQQK